MMDLSVVPYEGGSGSASGKYRECLRNHAAAMGGHAFDGCGEFMPASPDPLKCAACGCHRNFHRRTTAGSPAGAFFKPPPPPAFQPFLPPGPPAQLALPYHAVPAAWQVAAAAAAAERSRAGSETPPRREEGSGGGGSSSRKRYRTKFTPEQKEKMRAFAEKLGWRIQRHDDGALERFCVEIGIKRHVLKVWMHNHKNHLASSPTSAAAAGTTGGAAAAGNGDDDDTDDSPPRAAVSSPSPSPISV